MRIGVNGKVIEFPDGTPMEEIEAALSSMDLPEEPAPAPQGGLNKSRGAVQSWNKGALFGWGDEIVGKGRAAVDELLPNYNYDFGENVSRETQTPDANYLMYRDDERATQEQFAAENPKTALGLEFAGAIASPSNAAGGAGAGLLRTAGRASLEGAVAGAGEAAEQGDIAREAGQGAGIGALTAGLLRGGQGVINQATKRRIAQDLITQTGEQMPINLAAGEDSLLGDFYRQVVGRAWGARNKLLAQERPFREAAENTVQHAEAAKDAVGEQVQRAADEAVEETRIDRIAQQQALAAQEAGRQGKRALTRAADQALEAQRAQLRRAAINEAIPASFTREQRAAFENMNSRQADNYLRNWFSQNGFQMVKGRTFRLDSDLTERLVKLSNDDPALRLELGSVPGKVGALFRKLGAEGVDYRPAAGDVLHIDGDAMMALRNYFAMPANKGASLKGKVLRDVADQFDAVIGGQLREADEAAKLIPRLPGVTQKLPSMADAYTDELYRWKVGKRLSNAVEAARKQGGEFNEKQWLSKRGTAPLQAEADAIANGKQVLRQSAKDRAARVDVDTRQTVDTIKAQAAEAARQARVARKLQGRSAKRVAKRGLDDARAALQDLNARAVPKRPSGLSSQLTTEAVGDPVAAFIKNRMAGTAAALIAGTGIAQQLVRPGVQRAFAGQTGAQRFAQGLAENERARQLARMLRTGASRTATLEATGD